MKKRDGQGHPVDLQMPFTSHLAELRSRLIKSFVAVGLAFLVCFAFVDRIFVVLVAPLRALEIAGLTVIGTAVAEAFLTQIKISFFSAVVVALPVLLWQAWQFVAPGLYEHEKQYTRSFVFFGSLLFITGVAFCYLVVLQLGLEFLLLRYEALGVQPMIRVGDYLSLVSRLVLAFGVMFELPVVAYFLARVGLIDHRFLIRQARYGIVIMTILAAILTPPDIVSQVLLLIPLIFLYGVSIGVAYFATRPKTADRQTEDRDS